MLHLYSELLSGGLQEKKLLKVSLRELKFTALCEDQPLAAGFFRYVSIAAVVNDSCAGRAGGPQASRDGYCCREGHG